VDRLLQNTIIYKNTILITFILKIKTTWKWSALNYNCFVHWERDLIPNEKREGNPTKLVVMTETEPCPST